MRAALLAACALAASAAPARASVWADATGGEHALDAETMYTEHLAHGDDEALEATARGNSRVVIESRINDAIASYTSAAAAKPTAAEPYARIGKLIYSFYFELCDPDPRNARLGAPPSPLCGPIRPQQTQPDPALINSDPTLHKRAEQMLAAWAAFEERAPLDPRIDHQFLFERAIIHTKLATRPHLEAAARDYETIIRRYGADGDETTFGNLAETYMMLGRLDEAIDMYKRALASGGDSGTIYGLAVALDRDEREELAHDLIIEAGEDSYQSFLAKVKSFQWFFVPPGERFYYLALVEESFGELDAASADWARFVASGAHPMYQPRAKAHLAQIELQRKLHPRILRPAPQPDPFDE